MNYRELYEAVFAALGDLTPLRADCGQVCGGACCKGNNDIGMRLFPHENTTLPVRELENGVRLVVCGGTCDRTKRPLACRIFPFFPTIDDNGDIFAEADDRAYRLCPLIAHSDDVLFDERFLEAVEEVGRLLSADDDCRAFLEESTAEIDTYREFLL